MRISDWSSDVCSSDLVLLQDVDRVRWRQDLIEDRNRLATLLSAARAVPPERDAKLAALKELIAHKVDAPINGDNRKLLLFKAFADPAEQLYRQLAGGAHSALAPNHNERHAGGGKE